MAYQMKKLCVFLCVPLCRRGSCRGIRGYPEKKKESGSGLGRRIMRFSWVLREAIFRPAICQQTRDLPLPCGLAPSETTVSGRRVPPRAVKTCAVRPVFARVVGRCGQQSQANVQGPMKQNASPREQSEAPRRRWKPGQEQHPEPQNQDSQHMLNQPRGSFPESETMISIPL